MSRECPADGYGPKPVTGGCENVSINDTASPVAATTIATANTTNAASRSAKA
jgi:hypothetical protein